MNIEITSEQILQHFNSAMDSVNLINQLRSKPVLTEDEALIMAKNKEHLRVILSREYWTFEDLSDLRLALNS